MENVKNLQNEAFSISFPVEMDSRFKCSPLRSWKMSHQTTKTSTALCLIRFTDRNQWEKILFGMVREAVSRLFASILEKMEGFEEDDNPLRSSQFSIFSLSSDQENNQETRNQELSDQLQQEIELEDSIQALHEDDAVEDQENLGFVTIEEGKVGKDGKPGKVFYHENFAFHQKTTKRGAQGQSWLKCKISSCPAKLVIAADERTVLKVYGGAHIGHQSNLVEREIERRVKNAIKENKKSDTRANTILKEVQANILKDLGEGAVAYMPERETLAKRLKYRRDKELGLPPPCHSYEELKEFPESLTKTAEGLEWLRLNKRLVECRDERILIFCSDFGKKMLEESSTWLVDGTYKAVSKLDIFYQLFCIVVPGPNSGVGCVALIAFLPNKTQRCYQEVLTFVTSNLGIRSPDVVYSDFEAGITSAVTSVLGCNIRCCDVHWRRLINDRIAKLGLKSHYSNDLAFQLFIRRVWACAMLPAGDISEVFTKVVLPSLPKLVVDPGDDEELQAKKLRTNNAMDQMIEYLMNTYFGIYDVTQEKVTKRPIFRVDKISKYEALKNAERTDTNLSESFHAQLVLSVGQNPNIWKLVLGLQKEESNAKVKWLADSYGKIPKHLRINKAAKVKAERQRLARIVNKYEKEKAKEFIVAASSSYSFNYMID